MYIFPTYLPNIKISEYATANQWFFVLDVTGNTHIIIEKSGGYIVMGMFLFFDLSLVGR